MTAYVTVNQRRIVECRGEASDTPERPRGPDAASLGAIIGQFKARTTRRIMAANLLDGSPWQRNYYEHIIRNAHEYEQICAYIVHNPARWAEDVEYPA